MTADLTARSGSRCRWRGALHVDAGELDRAVADGWARDGLDGWTADRVADTGTVLLLPVPNLVVNVGVNRGLDRLFGVGVGPLTTMGVDDGASGPVAGTTSSSAGSANRRLVTFDAAPSRTGQTMSVSGTFTQASVSFVMRRLFLSAAAAGTTDAAGDLYAMTEPFTIDLTPFSTWSQTFEALVTGSGS